MNRNNRIAATMYSLGTLFVSGIYVQIPCHKGDDDDDDNNNNNNNNNEAK
jgi:hypothetical protein